MRQTTSVGEGDDLAAHVEALQREIETLVIARQALRERGATKPELERNRRALAALEWELSRAVVERHVTGRLLGHAA